MNIVQRAKAPTPKFFKKLRNIGLTLAAISTVIVTAPIALPAAMKFQIKSGEKLIEVLSCIF